MTELRNSKIRLLDGTLLLVFRELLRTGKASAVALELGVTNSSISHSLARLRDVFDDPLFLRRPHGLEPTAFARELAPELERAVEALFNALAPPKPFAPEESEARIRISARDSEIASTFPGLIRTVRREAPGVRVSVVSTSATQALDDLRNGRIDIAVGFFYDPLDGLAQRSIREEGYLVVGRKRHPLFRGGLTLENYLSAEHLLVASDGGFRGVVDRRLESMDHSRRVVVSLPLFLPAMAMVAVSDLIGTLPARLVRRYAKAMEVTATEPPLEIRRFELKVVTHPRSERNRALQWMSDLIAERA